MPYRRRIILRKYLGLLLWLELLGLRHLFVKLRAGPWFHRVAHSMGVCHNKLKVRINWRRYRLQHVVDVRALVANLLLLGLQLSVDLIV